MFDLNWTWVEIECPNCKYQDEIQLVDAKTERVIFCHNCKSSIELKDSDASVHSGIDSINRAVREFEKALKNFGK
jgi:hypothetical protein